MNTTNNPTLSLIPRSPFNTARGSGNETVPPSTWVLIMTDTHHTVVLWETAPPHAGPLWPVLFGQQVFAEDGLNAFLLVHPLLCQSMCEPLEEGRRKQGREEAKWKWRREGRSRGGVQRGGGRAEGKKEGTVESEAEQRKAKGKWRGGYKLKLQISK